MVQDIKLFGNFLHTEFKKLRSKLRKSKGATRAELAQEIFHRTELLWAYRERYMTPVRDERYLLEDEVIRAFCLTDEYLSYRLELLLLKAREILAKPDQKQIPMISVPAEVLPQSTSETLALCRIKPIVSVARQLRRLCRAHE